MFTDQYNLHNTNTHMLSLTTCLFHGRAAVFFIMAVYPCTVCGKVNMSHSFWDIVQKPSIKKTTKTKLELVRAALKLFFLPFSSP